MLLGARILRDVQSVNSWEYAENAEFTQGDTATVYIQLVDLSKDTDHDGFAPPGRRYMPASGATLSVVVDSINDSKKITRAATQPYASSDPSIWALSILSTDNISGTLSLKLTLVEGSVTTRGALSGALRVQSQENFI